MFKLIHLSTRSRSLDPYPEGRKLLLDGIKRVAVNMGRVAGLAEDKLPEVIVSDDGVPPSVNDAALLDDMRATWKAALGDDIFHEEKRLDMGAEDFGVFTEDPYIPSVYFAVGGTPQKVLDAAEKGGPRVATHHSPLFKIEPKESVTLGVKATVVALKKLLQADAVAMR